VRHRSMLAALGCAAMFLAGSAGAAEDSAKPNASLEEARQHAAKAKVHYDLGEFEKAAEEYTLVYRIRPLPALLFNIAQSYRQAGQYEKAKQFYKAYLRESPDAKNSAQVKKALKEIEELQAKEKLTKDGPPRGVQQPPDTSLPMKPPAAASALAAATQPPSAAATTAKPAATPTPPTAEGKPASKPDVVASAVPGKAPATAAGPQAVPAVSGPAVGTGLTTTALMPQQKSHTLRWVAVGATAVAFAGGAAFGIKTISSRSHDDASKANLLYGIGAGLAVVTGAMFLFDF